MADKKNNRRNNRNNNDDDFNPKFKKRKKVCPLCKDKNLVLDYKNPEQLKNSLMKEVKYYQEELQVHVLNIKEILL